MKGVKIMFDFMKDLYFEMNDYDMDMIREEKKRKIEKEKADTIIFKKKTKIIFLVVGILLLVTSVATLIISVKQMNIGSIIKNSILIVLDISTIICMMIKKKQTEVASLVGMALIAIITFMLPMI